MELGRWVPGTAFGVAAASLGAPAREADGGFGCVSGGWRRRILDGGMVGMVAHHLWKSHLPRQIPRPTQGIRVPNNKRRGGATGTRAAYQILWLTRRSS